MSGYFRLHNTDEFKFKAGAYDRFTQEAVEAFQIQAKPKFDGLAGMETLHRLDKVLVSTEKFPFIGPPSP
jgi:hypothetical protein